MKKSLSSRLDFARKNNQYVASLLKESETFNRIHDDENLANSGNGAVQTPTRSSVHNPTTPTVELARYPCVCDRKPQVFICEKCKMYIYGRVSEICQAHPNVSYLLDLFYCPSCLSSKDYLKVLSN